MLKGYKTYITAVVAIVGAVGGYLAGDIALADGIQIIVTAAMGAFIRSGVKADTAA